MKVAVALGMSLGYESAVSGRRPAPEAAALPGKTQSHPDVLSWHHFCAPATGVLALQFPPGLSETWSQRIIPWEGLGSPERAEHRTFQNTGGIPNYLLEQRFLGAANSQQHFPTSLFTSAIVWFIPLSPCLKLSLLSRCPAPPQGHYSLFSKDSVKTF